MDDIDLIRRRLDRERRARKQAEAFIEDRMRELYIANEKGRAADALRVQTEALNAANEQLQREIARRLEAEAIERDRRDLLERIVQGHSLDAILSDLVRAAERQLKTGAVIVLASDHPEFVDRCVQTLRFVAAPADGSRDAREKRELARIGVVDQPSRDALARDYPFPEQLALAACLWYVPIVSGERQVLGMLVARFAEVCVPLDADIERMESLSRLAALAVDHRQLTDSLAYQARYDSLTDLPNRALFQERLQQSVAHAARTRSMVAVLFIDLDGFKHINDTLGHHHGDKVLVEVARRIKAFIRQEDTLARMGGDEFTLILSNPRDLDAPARVAQVCLDALRAAIITDGQALYVSASIGISVFPRDTRDPGQLQRNADAAMYRAKGMGKGGYQYFTPELTAHALERLDLESKLRRATQNEELLLHYQPQFDRHGAVVGCEALVRWMHPERGLITPDKFILIAEECRLVVPIGQWVLREACRQMVEWHRTGFGGLTISVNVSLLQFEQRELVDTVRRVLEETGLPARALELELTESHLMRNADEAAARVQQLRELGVRLALDDFGTGYSSLSYLQRLPIDTLKIDRSFVQDIDADSPQAQNSAPIIRAIVALARGLGMSLVAEGVETEAQARFLLDQGCDAMQGFLFARPMPAQECEARIRVKGQSVCQ